MGEQRYLNRGPGLPGPRGIDGAAGVGVPGGGATGEILAKASSADHDTEWIPAPVGGGGGGATNLNDLADVNTAGATPGQYLKRVGAEWVPDSFTPDDITTDGTTNKLFTAALKSKLDNIASGATANATNAELRDRSTHTGFQPTSTITGLDETLAGIADSIAELVAAVGNTQPLYTVEWDSLTDTWPSRPVTNFAVWWDSGHDATATAPAASAVLGDKWIRHPDAL